MTRPSKRGDNDARGGSSKSSKAASPATGSPGLDRHIQAGIGDNLRAMYGELIGQPVPDRLVAILDKLGRGKGDADT